MIIVGCFLTLLKRPFLNFDRKAISTFSNLIKPAVNFINIIPAHFSYQRRFGSFFYVNITWKKSCRNYIRTKKNARKTLMKLTPVLLFLCQTKMTLFNTLVLCYFNNIFLIKKSFTYLIKKFHNPFQIFYDPSVEKHWSKTIPWRISKVT